MATRDGFAGELRELEEQALGGLDLVVETLDRLLEALREESEPLAAQIIADDDRIDGRYLEVHQGLLSLIALQAPVATDLRLMAALLQVIGHAERMGDQCVNVAKIVPLSSHDQDPGMLELIEEMCFRCAGLVEQSRRAFATRDPELAEDLVSKDDAVDSLNRDCFRLALDIGEDADRREPAMHMMLAARCLERLADNAVDVGEQTAFVVTGLFREFTDASRPRAPARP